MDAIDDLLGQLLEQPAHEWPAALEELCRRHADRAAELRRRFAILQRMGVAETAADELGTAIPEHFGPYRLLRRLGGGGMGIVYLARHDQLGRNVALKLIRPERLYFENARERFQREIEAVARLEHPGCVQIQQFGEAQGIPYFAMEHVDGVSFESLVQRLADRSPAKLTGQDIASVLRHGSTRSVETAASEVFSGPWARSCLRLVLAAAEALAHAHARGVVHRDLKPSNLMLTPEGRVVVIDFGLAVAAGVTRMTRSGAFLGSLPYMAPEQVRGDHAAIDARTDVYALGVCLYELLALLSPFESASTELTRERILAGLVTPLRNHNSAVGTDVTVICARAMDPDPRRRYPTMAEFAADLAAVLEHRAIVARPATFAQRSVRWARRRPALATALVLGALVVLLGPLLFTLGLATQRDRALAAEQLAKRREYAANIAAANAALLAGNGAEARRRLDGCAPELRGFEWRHLDLALDGSLLTVRAHAGRVSAVAISVDLQWLASGSAKGEVALHDATSGARRHGWPGDRAIAQLEFDAAGRELFCVDADGRVRVFDVAAGALLRELPPPTDACTTTLAAGARAIVRNAYAGRLECFDASTLAKRGTVTLESGHDWPDGLTLTDGERLLGRLAIGTFTLWDLQAGRSLGVCRHPRLPSCLAATPGFTRVAGADTWSLYWWDVTTDRVHMLDHGDRQITDVALTPDGRYLAAACASGEIHVYELAHGRLARRLFGHVGSIATLVAAAERQLIVSGGDDGTVRVWSLVAGPEANVLRGPGEGDCLAVARDGRLFLGARAATVHEVDAVSGDLRWRSVFEHWVNAMALTEDQAVLVANWHHRLRFLDARTGADLGTCSDDALRDYGSRMVAGRGPRDVYMLDWGGRLLLIDAQERRVVRSRVVHRGRGYGLVYDRERDAVLSVGEDGRLIESDGRSLEERAVLVAVDGQIAAVALRGDTVVTSEHHRPGQQLLCRRDRTTGALVAQIHAELAAAIKWLGDDRLVTGSLDGRLVLRDPQELEPIFELRLASREILDIGVDPRGDWLAVQLASTDPHLLFGARDAGLRGPLAERALVAAARDLVQDSSSATYYLPRLRAQIEAMPGLSPPIRAKALSVLPAGTLWWPLSVGWTLGQSAESGQARRAELEMLRSDLRGGLAEFGQHQHAPAARVALGLICVRLGDAAGALEAIAPIVARSEQPADVDFFFIAFVRAMASRDAGDRATAERIAVLMREYVGTAAGADLALVRQLMRELEDALGH